MTVNWAVQLYGRHVYAFVRTTGRKTKGNSKHALLGPAPVNEIMCWVLSCVYCEQ
jgi:hypothetical protein